MNEHLRSSDPMLDRSFDGFVIKKRLGGGGMATVYLGYEDALQREVAIKVMHRNLVEQDGTFYARFEREARTIAKLQHMHILPIFRFGQADELPYLVMRLMPSSLQRYLDIYGLLELDETVRIVSQVAEALDYAHQHNVVHRDLKPANILLDDKQNCYLGDFGLAYLVDTAQRLTDASRSLGTPEYMSPEQVRGQAAIPASDIYALGVMLYQLLYGKTPFRGSTYWTIFNKHLTEMPVFIDDYAYSVPHACQAVVLRAMAKIPEERYASAGELAEDLASAIAHSLAASSASSEEGYARVPGDGIPVEQQETIIGVEDAIPDSLPPTSMSVPQQEREEPAVPHRHRRIPWTILMVLLLVGSMAVLLVVSQGSSSTEAAADANATGVAALQVYDYSAAISAFETAIAYDITFATAYFNRGVAYDEQGEQEAARRNYETALEYDDQHLFARYRLAALLLDMEQNEEALTQVRIGINQLESGSIDLSADVRQRLNYMLRTIHGCTYHALGRLGQAEDALRTALEYRDAVEYPAEAAYCLAQVLDELGESEAAIEYWCDVIEEHDPGNERHTRWVDDSREHCP